MGAATQALYAEALEADRGMLWGLCYRMTGSGADADDIVQETLIKALESPPPDLERPLRPWLVRVAMNLSRDYLRRRRRQAYTGQWLPSPIPTDEDQAVASYEPGGPETQSPMARYEMLESVSFAFLLALEALTPAQRAVLLLRDVFDYSTSETAEALDMGEANVKVLLHRARRKMLDYDKNPVRLSAEKSESTRKALEQFLLYLQENNVEALERLLKEDAVFVSDGGGEVHAALNVVRGREKVVRLLFGLSGKSDLKSHVSFRTLNGLPAVVVALASSPPGFANLYTLHCEVDDFGQVARLNAIVAPSKLVSVRAGI